MRSKERALKTFKAIYGFPEEWLLFVCRESGWLKELSVMVYNKDFLYLLGINF